MNQVKLNLFRRKLKKENENKNKDDCKILTVEEMRSIVSSDDPYPIWIRILRGKPSYYPAVLDLRYEIIAVIGSDEHTCYFYEKDYGTKWIAYKNKPDYFEYV